jgi:DNA-binding transcriptional MerR regulator
MKMAELERRTGVNRETIRVLIRRGLIPAPERPKATVAHYTEDHVQGIQAIRQLQQQYRMTLNQIGNVLQGKPLDQRVESTAFTHLEQLVATGAGVQDQLVAIDSLLEVNAHAATDAKAFESLGMVDRVRTPEGDFVSYTDARLISIWGEMRGAGFDEEANFYPDSLDHYARASTYLAQAEAEKFLARTEGRMSETDAANMLQFALPRMLDFFGLLRMKFFIRNIKDAKATGRKLTSPTRNEPSLPAHATAKQSTKRKAS